MSKGTAFILGMFLVLAAILHGGVYTAGHDFVLNRFTGRHEFVPGEGDEQTLHTPARRARALTCTGGDGR